LKSHNFGLGNCRFFIRRKINKKENALKKNNEQQQKENPISLAFMIPEMGFYEIHILF
jgi:hypothetical protein